MHASHTLDIYGDTIHVVTTKKAARKLARRFDKDDDLFTGAFGSTNRIVDVVTQHRHVVIWIDAKQCAKTEQPDRELIDTIAHEASHAADDIGTDRGVDHEARAYIVGWITAWIWTQVSDRG